MSIEALPERVDRLCADAAASIGGDRGAPFEAIRARLREPMRIAIAGRVKAGKSTLLNALVGERLAPTDAGECTRIVTWYRYAPGYEVEAHLAGGGVTRPRFHKGETALDVELAAAEGIERIEIGWPARRLRDATYIDTPGLGSLNPAISASTVRFLGADAVAPGQADAVIYLMRHAHAEDVSFLEGVRDAGLPMGSPVNTVTVLSRADEVGGGRLDALVSARTIAARYSADQRISSLAGSVVPLAGLLAETGATLEESEFGEIRQLAGTEDVDGLLLSVDRFRNPELNPLVSELRERLLCRFGLFGIRVAVNAVREGRAKSSQALASELLSLSGIVELRRLIEKQFTCRAKLLVARSALAELREVTARLEASDSSAASRLDGAIEEIAASAHELAELDLLHQIAIGAVEFEQEERDEAERLAVPGLSHERLGLEPEATRDSEERAILAGVERWRQRAANPLHGRETSRACEVMARSYERLFIELRKS